MEYTDDWWGLRFHAAHPIPILGEVRGYHRPRLRFGEPGDRRRETIEGLKKDWAEQKSGSAGGGLTPLWSEGGKHWNRRTTGGYAAPTLAHQLRWFSGAVILWCRFGVAGVRQRETIEAVCRFDESNCVVCVRWLMFSMGRSFLTASGPQWTISGYTFLFFLF